MGQQEGWAAGACELLRLHVASPAKGLGAVRGPSTRVWSESGLGSVALYSPAQKDQSITWATLCWGLKQSQVTQNQGGTQNTSLSGTNVRKFLAMFHNRPQG